MQHRLFVYGTLQIPERVKQIIGRAVCGEPATLDGYRCGLVERADFPGIVPEQSSQVQGQVLFGLTQPELALLDQYEGELYQRIRVNVQHNQQLVCWVYTMMPWAYARVTKEPWTIQWYQGQKGKVRLTYRT